RSRGARARRARSGGDRRARDDRERPQVAAAATRFGLTKEEALAQLVAGLEHELVPPGQAGAALDLAHDPFLGLADDAPLERRADDREVGERLAARQLAVRVEDRKPGRRPAPAR